ncbi:MAG: aspartate--tRNA ligase [Planctomycetes bacterium]|nr:aspartate--tRNA ligase [Planctomycetota bacterium]
MWKLKRTHTCGELRVQHVGQNVILNGWVESRRNFGNLIFVDLRDRYGKTQVLFSPDRAQELVALADALKNEWVIAVKGVVRRRDTETVNPKIVTGEIEVDAIELEVLNEAKTPPFPISEHLAVSEETRLQYRYLDLRRPSMQRNLITRHKVLHAIRTSMDRQNFVEIETPYLVKFTPGGARNFLVPSRHFPGRFFALAESPQIFKQLSMVAGYDRYYQIARCFRDEDLRADRQLEFTQLDMEMSFVQRDDVMDAIEQVCVDIWKAVLGLEVPRPFARLSYADAMREYGTDKPDLRFEMKIWDVTGEVAESGFKVFAEAAKAGVVRGLTASGAAFSRKDTDVLETFVKGIGAKGLISLKVEEGGKLSGGVAKFLGEREAGAIRVKSGAKAGDTVFMIADEEEKAASVLGALRNHLAARLDRIPKEQFRFCWVVDFPMFEKTDEGIAARHHPFTSPKDEHLEMLEKEPLKVQAKAYDLVLNGFEIGGGSIRIHRRDIQQRIFRLLGLTDEYLRDRFGFLLEAFEYGAPPHGGIALGIDRLSMLILGLDNIRDVITFPKTQRTTDLMMGSPGTVTEKQLKELHVRVVEDAEGGRAELPSVR